MERRIDRCLALCRDWAEGRVASGNEPPWAWYQYMKLIETVTAIQTSRAAVSAGAGELARAQAPAPESPPKRDAVADIGARRRQRRDDDDDDDEDPSLPM
ncbi:MAG TPA: hypothetical protein VGL98_03130 [Gammaproteobacteria bacterium]